MVARRIFDSITPSWEQIGAVWLPLPHVLNMLPVQIDCGLPHRRVRHPRSRSLALGVGAAAIAAMVMRLTGSRTGAVLAAALFAINPNVLYLQSTPMTEPLLFGTTLVCAWLLTDWATGTSLVVSRRLGWWMVAACLTRYEAWPVVGALVPLALIAALATRHSASRSDPGRVADGPLPDRRRDLLHLSQPHHRANGSSAVDSMCRTPSCRGNPKWCGRRSSKARAT